MIVKCPHCSKQLKLSEKVRESVQGLEPGKKIKLKCVHCSKPFSLDSTTIELSGGEPPAGAKKAKGIKVTPPAPPGIEWLKDGTFEDQEVVEDIPRAMVLMPDSPERRTVVKAAEDSGYRVEHAATADEAIEKMRFVNYASVFLHTGYESGGIQSGKFHQFMRSLNMSRRRYIFYVVIGDQFETLYDLQALAVSANLVVRDTEIAHISTILKKAIPEYEMLFGPLMEEMRLAGK